MKKVGKKESARQRRRSRQGSRSSWTGRNAKATPSSASRPDSTRGQDGPISKIGAVLSRREAEIFPWLPLPLRYKEIADRLGMQTSTLKTHVLHLLRVCGVHSRRELNLRFPVGL
jgi:DNA-binding NarL/FixJ family response regulator